MSTPSGRNPGRSSMSGRRIISRHGTSGWLSIKPGGSDSMARAMTRNWPHRLPNAMGLSSSGSLRDNSIASSRATTDMNAMTAAAVTGRVTAAFLPHVHGVAPSGSSAAAPTPVPACR